MAKLPLFRRIHREDVPEAPEWIEIFISVINQFFETTYAALNRALTFTENLNTQIQVFTITAGASPTDNTFRFALTMTKKPDGLIPLQIQERASTYVPLASATQISYHFEAGETVIDSIVGLTSGKLYDVRVLVI